MEQSTHATPPAMRLSEGDCMPYLDEHGRKLGYALANALCGDLRGAKQAMAPVLQTRLQLSDVRRPRFMKKFVSNLITDEAGASLAEYALLLALIAVAAIGALQIVGSSIENVFASASKELDAAIPAQ
jgi:pilus assembly protein Flp/PilA